MKSVIKTMLIKSLNRLGYDVQIAKKGILNKFNFFNAPPSLHAFLQMVQHIGYYPSHIIDVGANRGTWTDEVMVFFPTAMYSLFEPQVDLAKGLYEKYCDHQHVKINEVGVGERNCEMLFTLHPHDDCRSFLFDEQEAKTLGYKQITLPVTTIDTYVGSKPDLPKPDILKIDAEGFDIRVLEGARASLDNIELIFIEVGVNNTRYPNSAPIVVNWLDIHGYRLFDVTQTNRPFWPYTLWTAELVFVKKGGRFESTELLKQGGVLA